MLREDAALRFATCHPERKHYALNLCEGCYLRHHRRQKTGASRLYWKSRGNGLPIRIAEELVDGSATVRYLTRRLGAKYNSVQQALLRLEAEGLAEWRLVPERPQKIWELTDLGRERATA